MQIICQHGEYKTVVIGKVASRVRMGMNFLTKAGKIQGYEIDPRTGAILRTLPSEVDLLRAARAGRRTSKG